MSEFTVEKGIPAPSRSKYPFAEMKVNDSFAFPASMASRVRGASCQYGRRSGVKFTVRLDGDKGRCWRVS